MCNLFINHYPFQTHIYFLVIIQNGIHYGTVALIGHNATPFSCLVYLPSLPLPFPSHTSLSFPFPSSPFLSIQTQHQPDFLDIFSLLSHLTLGACYESWMWMGVCVVQAGVSVVDGYCVHGCWCSCVIGLGMWYYRWMCCAYQLSGVSVYRCMS